MERIDGVLAMKLLEAYILKRRSLIRDQNVDTSENSSGTFFPVGSLHQKRRHAIIPSHVNFSQAQNCVFDVVLLSVFLD